MKQHLLRSLAFEKIYQWLMLNWWLVFVPQIYLDGRFLLKYGYEDKQHFKQHQRIKTSNIFYLNSASSLCRL